MAAYVYVRRQLGTATDRSSRLVRTGIACGTAAIATLPWTTDSDTSPLMWGRFAGALVATLLLIVTVVMPGRADRLLGFTLGLSMFSFLTHGFLALFYPDFDRYIGNPVPHGLVALGGWLVCLAQTLDLAELTRARATS